VNILTKLQITFLPFAVYAIGDLRSNTKYQVWVEGLLAYYPFSVGNDVRMLFL